MYRTRFESICQLLGFKAKCAGRIETYRTSTDRIYLRLRDRCDEYTVRTPVAVSLLVREVGTELNYICSTLIEQRDKERLRNETL